MNERKRLLIEDWLPIAEIGAEALREGSAAIKPAPNRLHVWFARRPLIASRSAILASLLPADYDRKKFLYLLGIHGDPVGTRKRIAQANARGERLETDVYGYPRAFQHVPDVDQLPLGLKILDPTAGCGSIPFEAARLNAETTANDLNPVAALILRCTVEFPLRFGSILLERYEQLATVFKDRAERLLEGLFPHEPPNVSTVDGYLWARTVTCPYCSGTVPLSPNWRISDDGKGVRLVPHERDNIRSIRFEIVHRAQEHSPATVKGGDGICAFPDCGRTIDGDDIKRQAQDGRMGHQLYCVVYKEQRVKSYTKDGRPKYERTRCFRAPRLEDDVEKFVQQKLTEKMPIWQARNIVPDEEYPDDTNDNRPTNYGMPLWRDFFNSRQLFGHCVGVEVFHDMLKEYVSTDLDRAAMAYVALALDKMLNYNALQVRWHSKRELLAGVFDRHDFSFKWSYAEMAPAVTGRGYKWAFGETGKALAELLELLGQDAAANGTLKFSEPGPKPSLNITCGSADDCPLENASMDCIVMDPPYYQNVMYAELSDFFYVWLKRTAGLLFPDLFQLHLTDKIARPWQIWHASLVRKAAPRT